LGDFDDTENGSAGIDGLPNSGIEGDCKTCPLYGSRAPLTRSGERGNNGVPGDAGNLTESIENTELRDRICVDQDVV
jgi:hypothetical protein